jgi:hypothetical protein
MATLQIRFGGGLEVRVALRQGTASVESLMRAVPFKAVAHRWGDEVYFDAPFHADRERDARSDMEVGEIAFWPDGDALAIFFGPTPSSLDGRPRAYSPCNILGKVIGSSEQLRLVREGSPVEVLSA